MGCKRPKIRPSIVTLMLLVCLRISSNSANQTREIDQMVRDLLVRDTDFKDDDYFRYEYDIVISRTPLFGRVLDVATMLQWNKGDLGLSNHKPTVIESEHDQSARPLFTWKPDLSTICGGAREHAIHDYWLAREEPVNIMLDACFQSYLPDSQSLLGTLTGNSYSSAEYCAIRMKNRPRARIGQPDCLFIDLKNRRIALLEIKIAATNRKYDADQALKYFTLCRLLSSNNFFEGFAVDHLLIGQYNNFESNTKMTNNKVKSMNLFTNFHVVGGAEYGVNFKLISQETGEPIDAGMEAARRLGEITGKQAESMFRDTLSVVNVSWRDVYEILPMGYLKENIGSLLPYLSGDSN